MCPWKSNSAFYLPQSQLGSPSGSRILKLNGADIARRCASSTSLYINKRECWRDAGRMLARRLRRWPTVEVCNQRHHINKPECWYNAVSMLARCLRRWLSVDGVQPTYINEREWLRDSGSMLAQYLRRWHSVRDVQAAPVSILTNGNVGTMSPQWWPVVWDIDTVLAVRY